MVQALNNPLNKIIFAVAFLSLSVYIQKVFTEATARYVYIARTWHDIST